MKKLFSLLSLLFFFLIIANAQDNLWKKKVNPNSFPTNLYQKDFIDIEKFKGEIVAFDGTIEKIEISRNNTPFYKLKIADSNYLWTVLMFKNTRNKLGETIRVVGYLIPAEPNNLEKSYLDTKYMVIAFGLVDFNRSKFLFLDRADEQKKEWIDGKIPSSK